MSETVRDIMPVVPDRTVSLSMTVKGGARRAKFGDGFPYMCLRNPQTDMQK